MLKRMQKTIRRIRKPLFQIRKQPVHILPPGLVIHGAGRGYHGQIQGAHHMDDMFFRQIDQRTNDGDSGTAHQGFRMEGMETPFIEQAQQQRFNCVLPMVAEGELAAAVLPAGIGQHSPAHFRAQGAGILFLPVVKDDFSDLRFHLKIRHLQLSAQGTDSAQVEGFQTHFDRYGQQGKLLVGELPVKGKRVKEQQGILAAGDPDRNPVSRLNQPEILIRFAQAA